MRKIFSCVALVALMACQRGWGEDIPGRAPFEKRLAEQLAAMSQAGEHPKLPVPLEGKRVRLPLSGADARALTLTRDEAPVTVAWESLTPLDAALLARLADAQQKMGRIDDAQATITRALAKDPANAQARTIARRLQGLQGLQAR